MTSLNKEDLQLDALDDFDVSFDEFESDNGIEDSLRSELQAELDDIGEYTEEEDTEDTLESDLDIEIADEIEEESENTNYEDVDDFEIESNTNDDESNDSEDSAVNLSKDDENNDDENNDDRKKSHYAIEETEDRQNIILYAITDKYNLGTISYYRNYGVNISRIFTNLEEARDTLLMQVEPFRVVVIDSGTGRFTNMGSRKQLIDLLGICDIDTKIAVFYTDSAIKTDVELADEVEDKKIEWFRFKSTPDVVAHLLQMSKKENYIFDMEEQPDEEVDENILETRGLEIKDVKLVDIGKPGITLYDIKMNMVENAPEEELIPGYNIRIKRGIFE